MAIRELNKPPAQEETNPRAVIGNNRPPVDIEAKAAFDEIIDAKDGMRARIAKLKLAGDVKRDEEGKPILDEKGKPQPNVVVNDEEGLARASVVVKQINEAINFVNAAHTKAKEPYLEGGRVVDAAKRELVPGLEDAKKAIVALQSAYYKRQDDLRAEAAAADAKRLEEERKANAPSPADEFLADAGVIDAPRSSIVAPAPKEIIRTELGTSVSAKKVWQFAVEDYEIAFIAVANNDKVREAIDKAVGALVKGGVTKIEGVRTWQDTVANNR